MIPVRELRGPTRLDLSRYGPVLVDDLAGDGGVEVAEALREALESLPGPRRVDLVDRLGLDLALKELGRGRGQEWSQDAVTQLGSHSQARSLVQGRVSEYGCVEAFDEEEWTDSKGRYFTTRIRTVTAVVGAHFRVWDAATGKVILGSEATETVEASTQATRQPPPPIDCGPLLGQARQGAVRQLLEEIAPHDVSTTVRLYVDEDLPKLARGNLFAREGEWSLAGSSYREALEELPPELAACRYKPLYNLGIALGYLYRFEEALAALKEAHSMEPDEMVREAIERTELRKKEWQAWEAERP